MTNLKVLANYYYNLGFNVTHIGFDRSGYNINDKSTLQHWDSILKSPSHDWEHLKIKRQSISELNSFDWQNATGLGVVLGFADLRALDIDECSDLITLKQICRALKLPEDYEWIVKSGSGYHILFYADEHTYSLQSGKVKAFKPQSEYKNLFKHIELRWHDHLVLPPSIHPNYRHYHFLSNIPPYQKPLRIHLNEIYNLMSNYCHHYTSNDFEEQSGMYLDYSDQGDGGTVDDYIEIFNSSDHELNGNILMLPSFIFFDTETTGIPENWSAPISQSDNWPRVVQLAWMLYDSEQRLIYKKSRIIKPDDFIIPSEATSVHGITTEYAQEHGMELKTVLEQFKEVASYADYIVAHNINYDANVLGAEFYRLDKNNPLSDHQQICTMTSSTDYCAIPGNYGYKWPKLDELYYMLFEEYFDNAHDALADVEAMAKCFWELRKRGVIKNI